MTAARSLPTLAGGEAGAVQAEDLPEEGPEGQPRGVGHPMKPFGAMALQSQDVPFSSDRGSVMKQMTLLASLSLVFVSWGTSRSQRSQGRKDMQRRPSSLFSVAILRMPPGTPNAVIFEDMVADRP